MAFKIKQFDYFSLHLLSANLSAMKKNLLIVLLSFFTAIIFVSSCRKKAEVDTDTQAAEDNAIAEQSFGQASSTVVSVGIKEEGVKRLANPELTGNLYCATVTVKSPSGFSIDSNNVDSFPKRVTIDFGSGCTDIDGRVRKGKILAEYTNRWSVAGAKITMNFQNYSVDNVSLDNLTVVQVTNNGNYSHTTIISNGKITSSSPAFTIEYSCNQTTKWISGYNTDSLATDDVYEISGTASGVNRKGQSYTTVIMQALRKEMNCRWITKGQVEITPEEKATRSINFGDGACDNKATVTINGNAREIELP